MMSNESPSSSNLPSTSASQVKVSKRVSIRESFTCKTPPTVNSNHGGSESKVTSRTSRRVYRGRALFLLILLSVAIALGVAAYYLLTHSERNLATVEYHSIGERALDKVLEIALRKRLGTVTMASIAANHAPNASEWPFVTIRGYEEITQNLIATSSGREMGFCPLVRPDQLQAFEDFAYNYYYETREPEVFPNTTALSPFGRGVWGARVNPTTGENERYHEGSEEQQNGAVTSWNSSRQILAPILHHNEGPFPALMLNLHFQSTRGVVIDAVMDCAEARFASNNTNMECGAITDMLDLTSQEEGTGPGALIMQPIYASNQELVGIIASSIVWDETLVDIFASAVSGIDCVLKTSKGSVYTYTIKEGKVVIKGEGDLHDHSYDDYELSMPLTPDGLFSNSSASYELFIYPTEKLFRVYSTHNPCIAAAGAFATILLTSLFFFLYDHCVRSDIHHKQELLKSKRNFLRFVSHEVRTPLNAVVMGLTMMEQELKKFVAASSDPDASTTCYSTSPVRFGEEEQDVHVDLEAQQVLTQEPVSIRSHVHEWQCLTQDVLSSAQSAVDVLSDILNYDKVENGSLHLDLTKVDIWSLIHRTVKEFSLSAVTKDITLDCAFIGSEGAVPLLAVPSRIKEQMVVGDTVRITQVIRNLISNAIKFTPCGGNIKVVASWQPIDASALSSQQQQQLQQIVNRLKYGGDKKVKVEETTSGYIHLNVTDTGAGMSAEQLSRLFTSGVQFDPNKLQAGGGSGLGLFISKGIAEQHQGSLKATSEGLGSGSTFTLTLPLTHVPEGGSNCSETLQHQEPTEPGVQLVASERRYQVEATIPSEPQPMKILVVDDAPINLKLLMKLLEKNGHSCDKANDGLECVDKIVKAMEEGWRYDTILLDYQMPNMSGPEAAKEIRRMGCDSFIVGITGNVLPEDTSAFKAAGANSVLPKPFRMPELESLWVEYGVAPELRSEDSAAKTNDTFDA